MRMYKSRSISAKEIINNSSESELERIIKEYGEERNARSIAKKIFREKPLMTTLQLAQIVKRSVPPKHYMSSAARVFQAFRIAVNSELEELETALNKSIDILEKGARIVVISYHSLEDRTVKKIFRKESLDCICDRKAPACTCDHKRKLNILTKKPVCAGIEEIGLNSRARSAKLRAAERD
jgi:16S rRNA (cytosine1402-N4)-methyltransferase